MNDLCSRPKRARPETVLTWCDAQPIPTKRRQRLLGALPTSNPSRTWFGGSVLGFKD